MKRSLYGERDYAFGQLMLTLRTHMGLTQAHLAQQLGISRRAVSTWELGSNYPATAHLKQLIVLGVELGAWSVGREAEEIRALWRAAHQKVLLDERWLQGLLGTRLTRLVLVAPQSDEQTNAVEQAVAQPALGPRVDWGEALDVPSFYGREEELALLSQWVGEARCRVVSVLGMGGIGKSALAVTAMHQVAAQFEVVIWRSLRDAPSCDALVDGCLQVLAPHLLRDLPDSLEERLGLLLEQLRARRVLLVLDNLEMLLEEGEGTGRMRAGFEGYARLLRRMGEIRHQSCLLLTSREKPADLVPLEGSRSPVRALRLAGLDAEAGGQLLTEKDVVGFPHDRERLVEVYAGNPLALNIVAQTIVELFGGEISQFLSGGTTIFGSITELLEEQWARLSPLEQTVLCWLAILREPVTLDDLLAVLVSPLAHVQVLEAVDGLRRRSLIERGQRAGSFTLQSVVLEYVTTRLVATASEEIGQGRLLRLREHGLSQAQAKEYVRQTQERLLLAPLLASLQSMYQGRAEVEGQLRALLDGLRERAEEAQGYGPANLVALLRLLRGELRGLDLSHVTLRGVSLQGVELQDATLSGAMLRECVFTETFDAITAVAISRNGQYWAAASKRGEVRVWREAGQTLHRVWQAHTDMVTSLAFSPDERRLASGSGDGSVKLWDVESRALLWTGWQTKGTLCLAFAPDGSLLASGGLDATVRLWDAKLGTPLQELPHPGAVLSLAWSPDGRRFASGDVAGTIRLWERQQTGPATCVQTLEGHSNWMRALAFAPDGSRLASGSGDGSVKLWEVGETGSRHCLQTLVGHTERVHCVAWSPDGRLLASGSFDRTIRLWDGKAGSARAALLGHSAVVNGLAFTPDSRHLLSGSDDGTLRLWDVERGESLRVMQGYTASLLDLDWSPDGTRLASAGADTLVILWEVAGATVPRVLRGHRWSVYGVAWSPDGSLLASSGWDNAIRLWDPATGTGVQVLQDLDHPETAFFGVAWSPDGKLLACGTFLQGVLVWDVTKHDPWWVGRAHVTWIRRVAWSPDGTRLVGGGDDGHVYVWDASGGTLHQRLAGHQGRVTSVAWSPDGSRLASGGGSRDGGELVVWDAHSGERVRALAGHPGVVSALSWAPSGELVLSGGSDGRLRWWEVQSGQCVRVREAHRGTVQSLKVSPDGSRLASCGDDGAIVLWDLYSGEQFQTLRRDRPYERLNITGIRGLSDAQKASLHALGAFEEMSVGGELPALPGERGMTT
jgi:WD40 repeat protein/transcriptional regulator with XRE-family HTH domain